MLVRSLVAGTVPVVTDRPDPGLAASCGGAHVSLVPDPAAPAARAPGPTWPRSGRSCSAARALRPGCWTRRPRAGGRVVTTYGMTETCGGCVYDGMPLDGVRVAAGPDGRIRIAGPVLFTGYRDRPGLTAAATWPAAGSAPRTSARSGRPAG